MPTIKLDYTNTVIKDTWVNEAIPANNYYTDTQWRFGADAGNANKKYRELVKFDLGLIPNNVIINSATLSLKTSTNAAIGSMNIHQITSDWNDTTVTWNTQPTYNPSVRKNAAVPGTTTTNFTVDLTAVVQDWVSETNFGMLIEKDDTAVVSNYAAVFSNDSGTGTDRPTLTIDYSIPTTDKKQVEFIDVASKDNGLSGTTTLLNLSIPATRKVNDFLIAYVASTTAPNELVIPSGWTRLSSNYAANTAKTLDILYKKSDGTESSVDFSFPAAKYVHASVAVYRNVKAISEPSALKASSTTVSTFSPNDIASLPTNQMLQVVTAIAGGTITNNPLHFNERYDKDGVGSIPISLSVYDTYNYNKTSYIAPSMNIVTPSSTWYGGSVAIVFDPVTNEAPHIDGTDGDLGAFSTVLTKAYNVSDTEGDTITITEKLNGTTIRTFTGTGAQTLDLTSQWATLPVGKHTISVEANDNYSNPPHSPRIRTWTFLKILAGSASLVESAQGLQDLIPFLNSKKAGLGGAIRAKGGTVNDTDSWDTIVSAVSTMTNKKWATGTATSAGASSTFIHPDSTTYTLYPISASGLNFTPSSIMIWTDVSTQASFTILFPSYIYSTNSLGRILTGGYYPTNYSTYRIDTLQLSGAAVVSSTGFTMPTISASVSYRWVAFE